MNHDNTTLFLDHVSKTYGEGKTAVEAVRDVTLEFRKGESVLILGPSGGGKTTLLSITGGLLKPTKGRVLLKGQDIVPLSENQLAPLRLKYFGFVFQEFNLLANLTALENVELVISLVGTKGDFAREKARGLCGMSGILHRAHHFPSQLSGGEKQRVAIMRALANNPPIILADEPTGDLDSAAGKLITQILSGIACKEGRTVIIVSHDERIKEAVDRILYMEDGKIIREEEGGHVKAAKEKHKHYLAY